MIIHLDNYRQVPTVKQQMEKRDMLVRQAVMDNHQFHPASLVALGCTAASDALKEGKDFLEAMDIADKVIKDGMNTYSKVSK